MTEAEIQKNIKSLKLDTLDISESKTASIFHKLLNLVEAVYSENIELKVEIQKLRDENNYLKGEQGKPDIKANNRNDKNDKDKNDDDKNDKDNATDDDKNDNDTSDNKNSNDHSSENERNGGKSNKNEKRNREPKLPKIEIDRKKTCPVDKSILPKDAVFKGYDAVTVQDIVIRTDNVLYQKEVYYSPSENRYYRGELPKHIDGEFGVGIRTLIPLFKSVCNMTESKILEFFENFGIVISSTYITNQWTTGYDIFHQEKSDIFKAGLQSSSYQQLDDTAGRVKGENQHVQILCNDLYSFFFTTEKKNRLSVIDALMNSKTRKFIYNTEAMELLEEFKLSKKKLKEIHELLPKNKIIDEDEIDKLLEPLKLGVQQFARAKESCAIAQYHSQKEMPTVDILMCDDAPQFKSITKEITLCWIHDGRHYKKLHPITTTYQKELKDFREKYWKFYHKLKDYKKTPINSLAIKLENEFGELFSTTTNYEELDDRIQKTLEKKEELLLSLKYPELPLHNNASELGARQQVRERDVKLHTMSEAGTKIKDTFLTISETCKKLGVRVYDYIKDRVSKEYKEPSLAKIITERGLNRRL
jgi:DNA-directed RNA polymerase subunit H (RpoH/RPB5)